MPIEFQKFFTISLPVHVRRKENGVYEARFRKYGYNISVSSTDYEKLKGKFFNALVNNVKTREPKQVEESEKSPLFATVAERWLDLKRPIIKANTHEFYESVFQANLLPAFRGRTLREIKQSDVQAVINGYIEQGKYRTATKLYQTIKAIFDFAVGEELLEKSPMRLLKPPKYEEKNGSAFSVTEEKDFLTRLHESKCAIEIRGALVFLLYTGIRRSELKSAKIEEGFVSVVCSKIRKGYQERRRLIPITPMLARWLPQMNVDELRTVRPDALTQAMKRLMPAHHLHELRHTFITRAQTCGVRREVVSVWAGHAADETQTTKVYTTFPREFMLQEGKKVCYNL